MKNSVITALFAVLCAINFNLSAQLSIDFSDASKTGYAVDTITFAGHDWELSEAIIAIVDGDRRLRLKGNGGSAFTQITEKENGIGAISFDYAPYGSDSQSKWVVEYSQDDGLTWIQVGDVLNNVKGGSAEFFNETVNIRGNSRFRIFTTDTYAASADRRLNVDNILITDWVPTLSNFKTTNGTNFSPSEDIKLTWQHQDVDELILQTRIVGNEQWITYCENETPVIIDSEDGEFTFTIPSDAGTIELELRIVDKNNLDVTSNIASVNIRDSSSLATEFFFPEKDATNVKLDLYYLNRSAPEDENPWINIVQNNIIIEFNKSIFINEGIIKIYEDGVIDPAYSFDIETSDDIFIDNKTLFIYIENNLKANTTYQVFIPENTFKDNNSIPNYNNDIIWEFTTNESIGSSEFLGLAFENAVFPAKNAVDVPRNLYRSIEIQDEFGQPTLWETTRTVVLEFIGEISLGQGEILINEKYIETPILSIDVEDDFNNNLVIDGNILKINLSHNLDSYKEYEVIIPNGAIKDLSTPANSWEGLTWSFETTRYSAGAFEPQYNLGFSYYPNDLQIIPENLFTYVEGQEYNTHYRIIINFDEAIEKGIGSITLKNMTLNDNDIIMNVLADEVIINNNRNLVIELSEDLIYNNNYQVTIENGAILNQTTSKAIDSYSWTFTVNAFGKRTIAELLGEYSDATHWNNYAITQAIVSHKADNVLYMQDDSDEWNGISVIDNDLYDNASIGDEYYLLGFVKEDNGTLYIESVDIYELKNDNQEVIPVSISLPFEQKYCNMLVSIDNVTSTSSLDSDDNFTVTNPEEKEGIINGMWYAHNAKYDEVYGNITGLIIKNNNKLNLAPRYNKDISVNTSVFSSSSNSKSNIYIYVDKTSNSLIVNSAVPLIYAKIIDVNNRILIKNTKLKSTIESININNISSGIYILKTTNSKGEIDVFKFIK